MTALLKRLDRLERVAAITGGRRLAAATGTGSKRLVGTETL